jgi:hypothetical protein
MIDVVTCKCRGLFSVNRDQHARFIFPTFRLFVFPFLAGGEMLSASSSSDLTDSIKENFFFNLIQELQFTLIACKPTNVPVKITNTCKIIDV